MNRKIDRGMRLPNLALARFARGLSQDKLAELSGVSRSAIMNLERGGGAFAETAKKLSDALGFAVWQLASRSGADLDSKGGAA